MSAQSRKVVMLDGDSLPDHALREHLLRAREIASRGSNPVLVYILEMAIEEFDTQGLSDTPQPVRRDTGVS